MDKTIDKTVDDPFEEDFRPRKRMKLKSWLILIFLPVALLLPSFAEFIRVGVVGREVVCCDSTGYDRPEGQEAREELEAQAARARENRQLADIIMKIGLFGGMALAGLVGVVFLAQVVRFLPGLLKVVFGLAIIAASGYVIYTSYRMWDYYATHTDDYYETDNWHGFRNVDWYLLTKWKNKVEEEDV